MEPAAPTQASSGTIAFTAKHGQADRAGGSLRCAEREDRFVLLRILARGNVRAGGGIATSVLIKRNMDSLEGFILAGGASSRMGANKAQLVLGGQTFVKRVAAALFAVTNTVNLVANNQTNSQTTCDCDLPIVRDVYKKWGALGGLQAALANCRADWAAVVACDLPFVTGELLARLAGLRAADVDAIAPLQNDGRPQPLCAIYRVSACLTIAEELIQSGEHRPIALLQSVRTRWVAFEELADLDGAHLFFDNLNTPDDYARALKGNAYQAEAVN